MYLILAVLVLLLWKAHYGNVDVSGPFTKLFREYASKAGVDWRLAYAIAQQESSLDPYLVSAEPDGTFSFGLMQVKCETARMVGFQGPCDQLLQPRTNIRVGIAYLRRQLDRYAGDVENAVAAYNAGTANRDTTGHFMNQHYVNAVLSRYGDLLARGGM